MNVWLLAVALVCTGAVAFLIGFLVGADEGFADGLKFGRSEAELDRHRAEHPSRRRADIQRADDMRTEEP